MWQKPPLYTYKFRDAVRDGYITDYEIRVPLIEGEITDVVGLQAQFVIDGMLRTASRNMIVYGTSQENCILFMKTLRSVGSQYHNLSEDTLWVEKITYSTTPTMRDEILYQFQKCELNVYKVITSVHILDEAIDIPCCDSVCILHPTYDEYHWRQLVQRVSRAVRLNPYNPNKVARVFLWIAEDHNIPKCLHILREYDPEYINKVRVQSFRMYDKKVNTGDIFSLEKQQTTLVRQYYKVKCLSVQELRDLKVQMIVDYITVNGQPPALTYVDESTKLRLGSFVNDIRHHPELLSTKQRDLLTSVYPRFFTKPVCKNTNCKRRRAFRINSEYCSKCDPERRRINNNKTKSRMRSKRLEERLMEEVQMLAVESSEFDSCSESD